MTKQFFDKLIEASKNGLPIFMHDWSTTEPDSEFSSSGICQLRDPYYYEGSGWICNDNTGNHLRFYHPTDISKCSPYTEEQVQIIPIPLLTVISSTINSCSKGEHDFEVIATERDESDVVSNIYWCKTCGTISDAGSISHPAIFAPLERS